MRPAILIAARPEPGVIGQKQCDTALVLPAQHQKRQLVGARHQGLVGGHLGADDAQPLAPGGRGLFRSRQVAGYRMAVARIRDGR